jgi:hypothetical protein
MHFSELLSDFFESLLLQTQQGERSYPDALFLREPKREQRGVRRQRREGQDREGGAVAVALLQEEAAAAAIACGDAAASAMI